MSTLAVSSCMSSSGKYRLTAPLWHGHDHCTPACVLCCGACCGAGAVFTEAQPLSSAWCALRRCVWWCNVWLTAQLAAWLSQHGYSAGPCSRLSISHTSWNAGSAREPESVRNFVCFLCGFTSRDAADARGRRLGVDEEGASTLQDSITARKCRRRRHCRHTRCSFAKL